MAAFEIKVPKMGESIEEATITKWFIKVGDRVEEDDILFEIATDKVDSEVPSPVAGKVTEIRFAENDKIPVNTIVAIIETESIVNFTREKNDNSIPSEKPIVSPIQDFNKKEKNKKSRFYSPLVKTITKDKNISDEELDSIEGSGLGGRVRKEDILAYAENRGVPKNDSSVSVEKKQSPIAQPVIKAGGNDQIIEMDRMRKLIADHMILSKHTAAHVTNFIESDVTPLTQWREKNKEAFENRFHQKLTFMPFFVSAIAKALAEYPMVNSSVEGTSIILRGNINIGFAVALPSGNLIVPVIKNADQLNIAGLAKAINELAEKARNNKLMPDDISGGTFTISNFGTFKNLTGTPVINQPQSAILATGTIKKKPAVIETPEGDMIAIRQMMMLSLSYDHRIIDGALGGSFLLKISELLENFETKSIL